MYEHSNKNYLLGVDIGGSHITAGLIEADTGDLAEDSITRGRVNNNADEETILQQWTGTLQSALARINGGQLKGIGFAIPGPFNYKDGICLMQGVNKYDALYKLNVGEAVRTRLNLPASLPVKFENDACCFGLGESLSSEVLPFKNIIAITLGTGFGASFIHDTQIQKNGDGIPSNGHLYDIPYLDGIAEDYISSHWLVDTYNQQSGNEVTEVFQIAERAVTKQDSTAAQVFQDFGKHLAACLIPWIKSFRAECLVIGGNIGKSSNLFLSPLRTALARENIHIAVKTSTLMELSAIIGAASILKQAGKSTLKKENKWWRKTTQALLPDNTIALSSEPASYDIYPYYNIGDDRIYAGYDSLAAWMAEKKSVMIDGYGGNDWKMIQSRLADYFNARHIRVSWYETTGFQKSVDEVNALVDPFLGTTDSVWGKRTSLNLVDFYDQDQLSGLRPDEGFDLSVIIGTGAAFAGWETLVYVDLPKNEIQYRMRAGSITNLGNDLLEAAALMYKRFYFVDWVVLNKHRRSIADKIEVIADGQWKDALNWTATDSLKEGLQKMTKDVIRARPWFEAGTWGGQWMKEHIDQINKNEVNYAWSFELIVPENGLVLESNHNLLEISFDWLMELQSKAVLGRDAERFGTEFPIRFDFLDTFDGGNLSIQCHPSLSYIQRHFGENITQDETYYILDCKEDAKVFLGFQPDINPAEFRSELENSVNETVAIDIEKYVQSFPAKKHDLFLIPNQTIHSSGKNNMVLEISATPYIFTFKMYDWVRLDLEGAPRPINIDHAFNNLNFERCGNKVPEELISQQTVLETHDDWQLIGLSTHPDHFYAIDRIELHSQAAFSTNNQCHILMLVEGESITVKTRAGQPTPFSYAETFIIPAAAEAYEITNNGTGTAKVIRSFIK